ncbi:kinesin-like protein KIFC1 [Eudromia elegans]
MRRRALIGYAPCASYGNMAARGCTTSPLPIPLQCTALPEKEVAPFLPTTVQPCAALEASRAATVQLDAAMLPGLIAPERLLSPAPGHAPSPRSVPLPSAHARSIFCGRFRFSRFRPPPHVTLSPSQKRPRPGPALPVGPRVAPPKRPPLRALAVPANRKAAKKPPEKKPPEKKPPFPLVSPVAPAPHKKRPPWDLKGQVSDLREALGSLTSDNHNLREHACALQLELEERERSLRERDERVGALERELEQRGAALHSAQDELRSAQAALATSEQLVAELQATTEAQQQELRVCAERLHALELERRRLHNDVQELKGNIRVFCRVRPPLEAERPGPGHLRFSQHDPRAIALYRTKEPRTGGERGEVRYDFTFDRVFPPGASQGDVFEEVALLVQSALDGYHVCIFAYGQTGSGKTYTMEGPPGGPPETRGLIPRAVRRLFESARDLAQHGWQYRFTASFLEIYNESLRDLLAAAATGGPGAGTVDGGTAGGTAGVPELEIRRVSAASEELHVPNLRRVPVATEEEVLALLQAAQGQRAVARTALNARSSRGHSVFQLRVEGAHAARGTRCASVLSLVDLAGSERLQRSLATGERLREAQSINASLSALALVILALANKEPHVPYRNSKLTYLLQNSLGGSAKMLMFVNISPLEEDFGESLNSLRFASQVNECVVGTAQPHRK